MADTAKTPGKGKKKGRILGLPWQVVVGGVVLAVAVGLYLRHRTGSSGASGTSAAPAQDTTGGGSGGGSSSPSDTGTGSSVDLSGLEQQLSDLESLLAASPLDTGSLGTLADSSATAPTSPYTFSQGGVSASDPSSGYYWPSGRVGVGAGSGFDPFGNPNGMFVLGPSAPLPAAQYSFALGLPSSSLKQAIVGSYVTQQPSKKQVSHPQKPAQTQPVPQVVSHPGGFGVTPQIKTATPAKVTQIQKQTGGRGMPHA